MIKIQGPVKFDLLRFYIFFLVLSGVLVIASLASIAIRGFNYGTDFNGGVEKTISFTKPIPSETLSSELSELGYPFDIEQIISKENAFIIRFSISENNQKQIEDDFASFLQSKYPSAVLDQTRLVSGVVSEENKRNAIWTSTIVIFLIVLYLTMRFEFRYAVAALMALGHDVLLMLGFATFTGMQVSTLTMVAVLTIFGYSVNDTIVVCDRIRELVRENPEEKFRGILSHAALLTISRTAITSLTTFFVILALYISTVGEYKSFSLLMILGIISGTYSSMYVAMPFLLFLKNVNFAFWKKQSEDPTKEPLAKPIGK